MAIKIAIDAGHGSQTAGKRTPDGYREHWINVKTAYYCEQLLKKNGIETYRIGWNDLNAEDDIDVGLTTRQNIIKGYGCDYTISLHANAYGNGWNSANGVETLIHTTPSCQADSLRLAQCVQNRMIEGTKQANRGVKKQTLSMCNCPLMGVKAACLVEIGFMTNQVEADLMKTEEFCKEQGEDAARGILDYLGIINNVTPTQNTNSTTNKISNTRLVEIGLTHAYNFTGVRDSVVSKAKSRVLQRAMNLDYGNTIVEDGIIGTKSKAKLGSHYVEKGEKQYMVTALEIMLYLDGIDPNGVELPGIYGNGLVNAVKTRFGGNGTRVNASDFLKLLS